MRVTDSRPRTAWSRAAGERRQQAYALEAEAIVDQAYRDFETNGGLRLGELVTRIQDLAAEAKRASGAPDVASLLTGICRDLAVLSLRAGAEMRPLFARLPRDRRE